MFIVLEGLDGAGTTTQMGRIARALRATGREVVETREPTDAAPGRLIRDALAGRHVPPGSPPIDARALALLFAADRVDHIATVIEPAVARGAVVLSDRYVHSSLAYQGSECDLSWVDAINRHARRADLTLFIEVSVGTALSRIESRGAARDRFEQAESLARVQRAYEVALRLRPENVVRVDGEPPADAVEKELVRIVSARLSPRM